MGAAQVDRSQGGELDEFTLRRAQAGNPEALRALVVQYQRPVYALVGRILAAQPALVDDTAQEAFLKVLNAIPRFDPGGPARLSTWILTIATRTSIDALRKVVPLAAVEERVDSSPERALVTRDLGRRVSAAMAALPSDWRAALVLRAYHDFDYPEIATALGIEIGTVKSRIARARQALREALGEEAP
jgi:RNA polymerase sigma-70 factor (ECF subfamily)